MAAYTGNSSKAVSSSFLYSTLQTFYTKIKGLLDSKITNNPFVGSGTSGTSGYIAFAQLVITSSYTNRPIEFELICNSDLINSKGQVIKFPETDTVVEYSVRITNSTIGYDQTVTLQVTVPAAIKK